LKQHVAINNPGGPGGADGQLELSDREWGWGVNLGLLYEVDPATRLGLTWNSQLEVSGWRHPVAVASGQQRLAFRRWRAERRRPQLQR